MNTLVTRLTPTMPAAIATLGIVGPEALSAIESFVRLPRGGLEVGGVRFATWRIPLDGAVGQGSDHLRTSGEHVVLTRPAEDMFEVHCHGGAAVCQRLLSDLVQSGCVAVASEHWPSRLSCPLARAAEQDLQLATTDRAAAVLLDQMNGALRRDILAVLHQLSRGISLGLTELLGWADFGAHLSQPWKIVLAGPPNVGKSSLLNALAGTRQAIVHHEPGTTRDWIQWPSAVDGWPVVFTDIAGVRSTTQTIERAGIEQGLRQLCEADLAVLVVDAQQGWTEAHTEMLALAPPRRLFVYNKVDLESSVETEPLSLKTSAIDGTGIEALLRAIAELLVPETPAVGTAVPFRADQVARMNQSWQYVQAGDWSAAVERLGECLSEPAIATLGANGS